jgi:hypothetical protein
VLLRPLPGGYVGTSGILILRAKRDAEAGGCPGDRVRESERDEHF